MKIERHAIAVANWPEMLPGRRARLRSLLYERPVPDRFAAVEGLASAGQTLLSLIAAFDRDAPDQFDAARSLGQGYAGTMRSASGPPGQTVEVPFGDRRATLRVTGPSSSAHVGKWRDGWYGALMARDAEALDLLAAVPDDVLRKSSTQTDEFNFTWKAALIAARSEDRGAPALAEEAIRLTRPENLRINKEARGKFAAATFALLSPLLRDDATAFNDALAEALRVHAHFYATSDPVGGDIGGWVAWGPLALACVAHDRGLPIEVESDYLLPRLIEAPTRS